VRRSSPSSARDGRLVVVRIIDRLNVGGPALHAVLTTRGLDPARFRTVLVRGSIEPGEADMGYLVEDGGVEEIVIPSLGRELRPLRDLVTFWKLYRTIRALRPDVVHTHKAKAGALGRIAALLAGVPVRVHTYHGHVFAGYFGPAKTQVFLGIERALARITHRLVALSNGLVDELSSRYGIAEPARFSVVPLGLDLAPFTQPERHRGALKSELGLDGGVRLVGIVGRMVPVKDHRTFVEAAALVAGKLPDVHFVFVGGGELEAEVRATIAERGLAERTHLVGWRRDLDRIYPDLDVVALFVGAAGGAWVGSFIGTLAMPVVGTAVGGVPDLLRDRGEMVPPRDPAALAVGIERALGAEANRRAASVRQQVLEAYGYERLCRDLAELYATLLR